MKDCRQTWHTNKSNTDIKMFLSLYCKFHLHPVNHTSSILLILAFDPPRIQGQWIMMAKLYRIFFYPEIVLDVFLYWLELYIRWDRTGVMEMAAVVWDLCDLMPFWSFVETSTLSYLNLLPHISDSTEPVAECQLCNCSVNKIIVGACRVLKS